MGKTIGGEHMLRYQPGLDLDDLIEPESDYIDRLRVRVGRDDPDQMAILYQLAWLDVRGHDIETDEILNVARILAKYPAGPRAPHAPAPIKVDPFGSKLEGPFVYYIQIRDTIKIGFTRRDPEKRRAALAGDRILALEYGDMKLEWSRHQQFDHLRADIPGSVERFFAGESLIEHIKAVRAANPDIQP